jgi:hypothetical protein
VITRRWGKVTRTLLRFAPECARFYLTWWFLKTTTEQAN